MPLNAQRLVAQKNLSYVLTKKLAQRILKGKYTPGAILPGEIKLGDQLDVSRIAIREAAKISTAKGVVLPRPRIGTRVMPQANRDFLDRESLAQWATEDNLPQVIKHFLVMRISLKSQTCLLTATVGTAEQEAHPNTLVEEMVGLRGSFKHKCWIKVDIVWYEHIYEMSANPFLIPFTSLFHSIYQTYFTSITYNDVAKLDLHQAIVDAIDNSDGDRAFATYQALLIAPNMLPDR